MGLILDSSVMIAAERGGDSVERLIEKLVSRFGDQDSALSSIRLTELVHGIYRAATPQIRIRRQAFIDDRLRAFTADPCTKATAILAATLHGEAQAKGVTIPFADLLIGATALFVGFSLLTANLRHFNLIPGLNVIAL